MQNESQIRQKFKQAAFRHRKRLLEESLEVCSANCQFSCRPVLGNGLPASDLPRICTYVDDRLDNTGLICDDLVGVKASECPYYAPLVNSEAVKESFKNLMSGPRGDLAREYPDLAALSWVLDESPEIPDEEEPIQQESDSSWVRTKLFLQRLLSVF